MSPHIPTAGNLDTDSQRARLSIQETLRRTCIPYRFENGQYIVEGARINAAENPFDPGISDRIREKIAEAQKMGVAIFIDGEEVEQNYEEAA